MQINEPTSLFSVLRGGTEGTTALTDVYYCASTNNGKKKANKGIVACNKELLDYIAMELDSTMITNDQLEHLANSIEVDTNLFE